MPASLTQADVPITDLPRPANRCLPPGVTPGRLAVVDLPLIGATVSSYPCWASSPESQGLLDELSELHFSERGTRVQVEIYSSLISLISSPPQKNAGGRSAMPTEQLEALLKLCLASDCLDSSTTTPFFSQLRSEPAFDKLIIHWVFAGRRLQHLDAVLRSIQAYDRRLASQVALRLATEGHPALIHHVPSWIDLANGDQICQTLLEGREYLLFAEREGSGLLLDRCSQAHQLMRRAAKHYPLFVSGWFTTFAHKPWAEQVVNLAIDNTANEPGNYTNSYNMLFHARAMHNLILAARSGDESAPLFKAWPRYAGMVNRICQRATQKALDVQPAKVLRNWRNIRACDHGHDVLVQAAKACVTRCPKDVLNLRNRFQNHPGIRELFAPAMRNAAQQQPAAAVKLAPLFKDLDGANKAFLVAARRAPLAALANEQRLKEMVSLAAQRTAIHDLACRADPTKVTGCAPSIQHIAHMTTTLRRHLENCTTIREQWQLVAAFLEEINAHFALALKQANENAHSRWTPVSITSAPAHLVLLDISTMARPSLAKIPLQIVATTKQWDQESISTLVQRSVVQAHDQARWRTTSSWDTFDLDGPKTAIMLMASPEHLRGIESDLKQLEQIYRQRYHATIVDRIYTHTAEGHQCMHPHCLLARFRQNLIEAIEQGREHFLMHYVMHGSSQGGLSVGIGLPVLIPMEQFAEVMLSTHRGIRLCDAIAITIVSETCFGAQQMSQLTASLSNATPPPIQPVVIVTSSGPDQSSYAGLTRNKATIPSPAMGPDNAGAFSYYWVLFHEYRAHLASRGDAELAQTMTFAASIRFADALAGLDSPTRQDARAVVIGGPNRTEPERWSRLTFPR